ncbi:MAG TPA: SPOR domain-containing protein, partial [Desulfuromonadales bacterium]|nr:SPOR domain-containing protein [Desulfuromonadales bacterium]
GNAVQFAKELQKKGISTRSENASVKMPLSLLSFGTFANRDQARRVAVKARALHLDVLVVRRH